MKNKSYKIKSTPYGRFIKFLISLKTDSLLLNCFLGWIIKPDVELEIKRHKKLSNLIRKHLKIEVKETKILDIGCGKIPIQTALFEVDGADIIGIDIEAQRYRMDLKTFIQTIKIKGIKSAMESLITHFLFVKRFFKKLSLQYGQSIPFNKLDYRIMNATKLSFPNNYFDFVYSLFVFEHINNVPTAIKEVNRVLKPSGIGYIIIDLFPSLSGGHHPNWKPYNKFPSKKVPPWDHLLNDKYPRNVCLNKLRLDQYRKIFQNHTTLFNEKLICGGKEFLTPELEKELQQKGYTRKDLTTPLVIFLCKKKENE